MLRSAPAALIAAVLTSSIASPALAADAPTPTASVAPPPGASTAPTPSTQVMPTPTPSAPALPTPHLSARRVDLETVDSRTVVLRGSGLEYVASVSLGRGASRPPLARAAHRLEIRIGTARGFAPTTARLVLHRASNGSAVRTAVVVRRTAATRRAQEVRWAWTHLATRRYAWGHDYISQHDCANFVSHALVAGGWSRDLLDVSSTALRQKLLRAGAQETRDTPRARADVRVGDVVQFDWHPTRRDPGDRDHTGIVTDVQRDARGRLIVRYSAHTDGGNDPARSLRIEATMDRPRHDPRGRVYFLRLPH